MNSLASQAMPFIQMLWRQKWIAVGVAWLVCTVGWIGIAFIPTRYESSTRIYLNTDPLLTPLLRGLAIDTNPARHLDFLQRTLLSRPNLEQLVRLTDLEDKITSPQDRETLFRNLAADVYITPITSNLMTISYRNKDPQTAKTVVQALLTIFAEKTAGSSRAEMDSAQRFLDEEIASYRDQLRAKDQQRAVLARQYPDLVSADAPGVGGETRSRLDQARAAVARIKAELDDAVTNRNSLKKELAAVPPMLSVDHAPQVVVNGGRALSPDEQRLAQMRSTLDTLRLKYTEQHPDIIATRAEIKQLEAEMKRSATESGNGTMKTQIPNAVYDQLKVKLVDAEGHVANIQRKLKQAEAEVDRIDKIARSVPAVVVEIQDLDRDYGILKRNYEEFVSRRQAAQIAEAADTKTEKIQFRVIDPPQVPLVPVEPKRPLLVSLVLLAGLGAGLATPLLIGQLDRSFATVTQLRDLGIPILGSVTRISLGAARRKATLQMAGVCVSAVALIAVYGTLLLLSLRLHSVGVS